MNDTQGAKAYEGPYRSPYTLHLKYPTEQLLFDAKGQRGSVGEESSTPEREWYSEETRKRCGGWGVSRWPNPNPAVFGYHEVFHVYVCAAATCQFTAIALFIA